MLIQPIIENSFKHGLLHKQSSGLLQVHLKKENDYLYICVEDDGVGRQRAAELAEWKNKENRKSGLIVTRERLALLQQHPQHKGNFYITDLKDKQGQAIGTRTEIWIPFLKSPA